MLIVLEGARAPSWNQMYAGVHWSKRKKMADEAHWQVRAALPRDYELFLRPVDITVTSYFESRALDCDNIAAKLYIDGLIGHVLRDDSPRYVSAVTTRSRVDRERPRVEIEITPTRYF